MPHPPYRISNSSASRGVEVVVAESIAFEAVPNVAEVEEEEEFLFPPILSWEAT
jgi:hypothetical protein